MSKDLETHGMSVALRLAGINLTDHEIKVARDVFKKYEEKGVDLTLREVTDITEFHRPKITVKSTNTLEPK